MRRPAAGQTARQSRVANGNRPCASLSGTPSTATHRELADCGAIPTIGAVSCELTPAGRHKLDEYIDTGADRERELLAALSKSEKQQLNRLLQKLLNSLRDEAPGSDNASR
jgi:hypothetical protein